MRPSKSPIGKLLDRYWIATANKLMRNTEHKRIPYSDRLQWVEKRATEATEAYAMKIRLACCPEGDYGKFLSTIKKADYETQTEKSRAKQALP